MPTLLRKLEDKDTVIFHCALSQQRGPGAALKYLREREAAAAAAVQKSGGQAQQAMEAQDTRKQTVYILDRGFVGWQETYALDERLTSKYSKELWQDGYWG
jgi:Cdc25 family phosphatase